MTMCDFYKKIYGIDGFQYFLGALDFGFIAVIIGLLTIFCIMILDSEKEKELEKNK